MQLGTLVERSDDLELFLGRLVGVNAVDAEGVADGLRDGALVAGDERDVADADLAEPRHEVNGVRPQPVADQRHPRKPTVDADEDLGMAAVDVCR